MIRAPKKIAHDLLRATPFGAVKKREHPEKIIRVYVTIMNRVWLPFLNHWDGVGREMQVAVSKEALMGRSSRDGIWSE
jgi:hypothetical protein